MESISLPSGLISIGTNALSGCNKFAQITIPDNVASIGDGAFRGCSGLTAIVVSDGNRYYDSRGNCNAIIETTTNTLLFGCPNTVIPTNVTSIGNSAFFGRPITSIFLPNGVTAIDNEAFHSCTKLETVVLPKTVTFVANYAFRSCESLKHFYCYAEQVPESPSYSEPFAKSSATAATLHVPASAVDAYKSSSWNIFKEIVPLTDEDLTLVEIRLDKVQNPKNNNAVYNLQGRQLQTPQKGLNIVNGKILIAR